MYLNEKKRALQEVRECRDTLAVKLFEKYLEAVIEQLKEELVIQTDFDETLRLQGAIRQIRKALGAIHLEARMPS